MRQQEAKLKPWPWMCVPESENCGISSSLNDRSHVSIKTSSYRTNVQNPSTKVPRTTMRCRCTDFELFATKAEEARTEREYLEAVRDYWITRAELERAVGGSLNPRTTVKGEK